MTTTMRLPLAVEIIRADLTAAIGDLHGFTGQLCYLTGHPQRPTPAVGETLPEMLHAVHETMTAALTAAAEFRHYVSQITATLTPPTFEDAPPPAAPGQVVIVPLAAPLAEEVEADREREDAEREAMVPEPTPFVQTDPASTIPTEEEIEAEVASMRHHAAMTGQTFEEVLAQESEPTPAVAAQQVEQERPALIAEPEPAAEPTGHDEPQPEEPVAGKRGGRKPRGKRT